MQRNLFGAEMISTDSCFSVNYVPTSNISLISTNLKRFFRTENYERRLLKYNIDRSSPSQSRR